ncbi:hypothetical protein [Marinomonas sp.]|uniref:hypothetical protein n=1 Tax=Marinomonas sp. TaxID=1904862 RepID=UPI003A94952B
METELFFELSYAEATYQLSDHFPLWIQLKTDNDRPRLDRSMGMLRAGGLGQPRPNPYSSATLFSHHGKQGGTPARFPFLRTIKLNNFCILRAALSG